MPNRLMTSEETGAALLEIWNRTMKPHIEKRRAEGATEEELLEIANDAIAVAFGGLWVSPK